MAAAWGDVKLLGSGDLIPYRPDRRRRTGVIAVPPTHKGGDTQRAREIDHIKIRESFQRLLYWNIDDSVSISTREKLRSTARPVMKKTSEVAQCRIERGANGDLLVESGRND